MKIIAMIPARLGSKRIPKKNIRFLKGKPLLAYPIDLAHEVNLFEEIVVNTESEIIGALAKERAASFYRRPEELATDSATNQDFVCDFLNNNECDFIVMINPTSPLLRKDTLVHFLEMVGSDKYDTVLSVVDEKAETFFKGTPLNFSLDKKINSQDLELVQRVVWALTAWRKDAFLKATCETGCGVFAGKIGVMPIPKDECCDLDYPEDWRVAEGFLESRSSDSENLNLWSPS